MEIVMNAISKNIPEMIKLTEQHIAADAVRQGHYWDEAQNDVGGNGCFIGCLTHGSNAEDVFEKFGLPEPLVKICENIFEALPEDKAKQFFLDIPNAIGKNGKDLSLVHWKFLAAELRALPEQYPEIQAVIDPVIEGMDLLASGKEWSKAAYATDAAGAAADAADVANATDAADAAYAAGAAADAAYDAGAAYAAHAAGAAADAAADVYDADASYSAYAARERQASTLIELLTAA